MIWTDMAVCRLVSVAYYRWVPNRGSQNRSTSVLTLNAGDVESTIPLRPLIGQWLECWWPLACHGRRNEVSFIPNGPCTTHDRGTVRVHTPNRSRGRGPGLADGCTAFCQSVSCFIWGAKREGARSIAIRCMISLPVTVHGHCATGGHFVKELRRSCTQVRGSLFGLPSRV